MAAPGDGAGALSARIWAGYALHLAHRVEILDFSHISERLAQVAAMMFGNGAADRRAAQQWRETQEQELLEWGPRTNSAILAISGGAAISPFIVFQIFFRPGVILL